MAENQSNQDRTEQATPKRLEEARKKGDVPRSRELTMAFVVLSGAAALLVLSRPLGGRLAEQFRLSFELEREDIYDPGRMAGVLAETAFRMFTAIAPVAGILVAAVFFGTVVIGGWSFSLQAAAPKIERISPAKGLKRIFSVNSLNELGKSLAKFTVIAVIAVVWLWHSIDDLSTLGRESIENGIVHAWKFCSISLLVISSGLLLIAMADVPFQLWQFRKKLRMTRQEVKEEMKETEGRPEVKSKVRALQQQFATRQMMKDLPNADVVITNPTHFAVALVYEERGMGAPKVIAKGKDLLAARIREVAGEHKIPLFSAPPLARALYRTTEIGEEIPARLYQAIAQILAYVYQLKAPRKPGQQAPQRPIIDFQDEH